MPSSWAIPWQSNQTAAAQTISYYPNNETVINAVEDLNLDNTGMSDCTATLNAAIADIDWNFKEGQPNNAKPNLLYFPDGIYKLTAPVVGDAGILFVGQSRDRTIFRLAPNSAAYQSNYAPVLSFGHGHHDTYQNFIERFTIEVGAGNPFAVALCYTGHNNSSLKNIRLRDLGNSAEIGLSLGLHPKPIVTRLGIDLDSPYHDRAAVGIHGFDSIEVEGFDIAIRMHDTMGAALGLTNFRLKNYRLYGIHIVAGGTFTFTNGRFEQSRSDAVPFCQAANSGDRSTTMANCRFVTSVTTTKPAIEHLSAEADEGDLSLYLEDTDIDPKFNQGLTFNGLQLVSTGMDDSRRACALAQYFKGPTSFGGTPVPQALAIQGVPQVLSAIKIPHDEIRYYSFTNPNDWHILPANANAEQIQAGFNSGKPAIGAQGEAMLWTAPIRIPRSVRLFHPARTGIKYADSSADNNGVFLLDILGSPADAPLEIRGIPGSDGSRGDGKKRMFFIRNASGRTLILNSVICTGLVLEGTPGICLIDHMVCQNIGVGAGWKLYGQNLDIEGNHTEGRIPDSNLTNTARIYAGEAAEAYVRFMKTETANSAYVGDRNSTISIYGHAHFNYNNGRYFDGAEAARFSCVGGFISVGNPYIDFIRAIRCEVTREFAPVQKNAVSGRRFGLAVERSP